MASFNIKTKDGLALEVNTDDATLDELLLIDALTSPKLSEEQKALIHAVAERRKQLPEPERNGADERARNRYASLRKSFRWRVPQHNGIRYLLTPQN